MPKGVCGQLISPEPLAQIFCASGQSQAFFACVFAYDRTGNGH
jgi:hypothetical protein